MEITLGELAKRFGLELRGDAGLRLNGVCALENGRAGCIAFLADQRHAAALPLTKASAVVLRPEHAVECPTNALLSSNPHLAFARLAALWDVHGKGAVGVDAAAIVSADANIDPTAIVCAGAVIQSGARVEARAYIGSGCVVGRKVLIGADSKLAANVTLMDGIRLGARVSVEAGAVIGGRGFGLAREGECWIEVPQLGSVVVGDDVEIGTNSTVARGAIENTVIEEGVKIDSQVHIAHNCRIGAHTVIAGCVGIAGSVTIGKRCILAGGAGVADHLTICDDVVVTGMSMVTGNITQPGIYSAGWGATPAREWRRQVAGLRRLPDWQARIKSLEKIMQGRRKDK